MFAWLWLDILGFKKYFAPGHGIQNLSETELNFPHFDFNPKSSQTLSFARLALKTVKGIVRRSFS
jgi:hypothetical protein